MSYHQWLSSAPKHHLTSSTADGFASFKLNTARPCPQQPHFAPPNHARRPMQSLPNSVTKDSQAPMYAMCDSGFLAQYSVASYTAATPPNSYLPITPPVEVDDVPQHDNETYQLFPDGGFLEPSIGHPDVGPQIHSKPSPIMSTTLPSHIRRSRDALPIGKSVSLPNGSGEQKMLPSPPTSPPQVQPKSIPRARSRSARHCSNFVNQGYNDPMVQTSTVPYYWTVNCTVLKADTDIEIGNVISPTCMIGLPFGGMTEMTLPLPLRE